jgi:hypothetical protein
VYGPHIHPQAAYVIIGMLPSGEWIRPVCAQILVQRGRIMTLVGPEQEGVIYWEVALAGVASAAELSGKEAQVQLRWPCING